MTLYESPHPEWWGKYQCESCGTVVVASSEPPYCSVCESAGVTFETIELRTDPC